MSEGANKLTSDRANVQIIGASWRDKESEHEHASYKVKLRKQRQSRRESQKSKWT